MSSRSKRFGDSVSLTRLILQCVVRISKCFQLWRAHNFIQRIKSSTKVFHVCCSSTLNSKKIVKERSNTRILFEEFSTKKKAISHPYTHNNENRDQNAPLKPSLKTSKGLTREGIWIKQVTCMKFNQIEKTTSSQSCTSILNFVAPTLTKRPLTSETSSGGIEKN
jgi:hypothetical protein